MAKKLDTYQMWEKTGVLKSKLDYIKAASATFYTQKEIQESALSLLQSMGNKAIFAT